MNDGSKLPRDLVWEGAHVSQVALTAIADGQESIVSDAAVQHVETCEWCAGRLGHAALLSSAVSQAMNVAKPAESVRAPGRMKSAANAWAAMGIGVAVSLVAAVPMFAKIHQLVSFVMLFIARGVPVLARGGVALATSDMVHRALPPATLMSSALLVAMGWAIARARSRSEGELVLEVVLGVGSGSSVGLGGLAGAGFGERARPPGRPVAGCRQVRVARGKRPPAFRGNSQAGRCRGVEPRHARRAGRTGRPAHQGATCVQGARALARRR